MKHTTSPSTLAIAAVCGLLSAGSASALTIGFTKITNNGNTDVASQLSVDVLDAGGGKVEFKFKNTGSVGSSITDIYFDDGSLLGIASVGNSAGVSFSQGASPGDLPGGNAVDFNTSVGDFAADSDAPTSSNGVNPGETVSIFFNLIGGKTYADTLAALALAATDPTTDITGGLRIGLHVQSIQPQGGSDSYVNTYGVSDNGWALALLGTGVLGLGVYRRFAVA
ncbi:MAG: hypothetical protein JNK85_19610 [Verrucomicrobiales bacterium]|nr:hypothetical protein [Verrucomicrobiales bacterium]